MNKIISAELKKIFARPRTYIGFAAVFAITGLIHTAMLMDGRSYIQFVTQSLESSFLVSGEILNGNLVAFIILQTLIIHIPLMVSLVTGDLISGEAAMGTIRLMLSKPYSRTQIIFAKYIAGLIYTLLLLIWIAILSLGLGLLLFGGGDLIVLKSDSLVFLQGDDVLWRFFGAFGIAFISLILVATFSFMCSIFTENSIGPIIITMSVIILFTIVGTIELPLFDIIRPFLFTTHMISWRLLFDQPVDYSKIWTSISIMLLHIVVFYGVIQYSFNKKDITS
jgi:ABC-2 type transport system permease protein